jgi:hypothetical protein
MPPDYLFVTAADMVNNDDENAFYRLK